MGNITTAMCGAYGFIFETGSYTVTHTGLELTMAQARLNLQPQPLPGYN